MTDASSFVETAMLDLIFVAMGVAFLVLTQVYAIGCLALQDVTR